MRRMACLSAALVIGLAAWAGPAVLQPVSALADGPGLLEPLTDTVTVVVPEGLTSPSEPALAPEPPEQATPPPALLDTVLPQAAPLAETVLAPVESILELTGPVLDEVAEAAGPLIEPVAELAAPLVNSVVEPVAELVAPAARPFQPIVGPVVEPAAGFAPGSTDGAGTPTFPPAAPAPPGTTDPETSQPLVMNTMSAAPAHYQPRTPAGPLGNAVLEPQRAPAAPPDASAPIALADPSGAAAATGTGQAFLAANIGAMDASSTYNAGATRSEVAPASSPLPAAAVPASTGSLASYTPSVSAVAVLAITFAAALALIGAQRVSLVWLLPPSRAIAPGVPPA